jgi:hypothetical protein
MGRASSIHGRDKKCTHNFCYNIKIELILGKCDGKVEPGCMWFMTGTTGGFL